jgi:hypothetical protein
MLPFSALDDAHTMHNGRSGNHFIQPRVQHRQGNSSISTFSSIASAARVVPPPAHTYSPSLRGRTRLPPAEPRPSSSNSRSRSRSRSTSSSSSSSLPVSNRHPSIEQARAFTPIGSGVLQQAQAKALTELKQGSQQGDSQQVPEAVKEEAELYPRINAWSDLEKCNELVYNQDLKQDQTNRQRHTRSSSIERFFDGTARLLGISGGSSSRH